jgi:4-amino-4-deoxy-L-arabinose transferase-like glycosyltransferase
MRTPLRPSRAVLVILALALVVRVGVIVATPDFRPIYDAGDYDRHAISIVHGHGYPPALGIPRSPSAFRPPLYPFALAAVYELGGGWTAGRVLAAILGVAAVLLVLLISQRLWGRRVGLTAGAIAAVFPPLVLLNASLLSEPLFVVLVLSALLATLRYRDDQRVRWAATAGVLCGLAALTRSNGTLLVLAALLGVWTVRPRVRRTALIASAAVVGCAVLTVAPWVVRNAIQFDRFVGISTQGGVGLASTYNAESRRAGRPGLPVPSHQLHVFEDLYRRKDLDEAELGSRLTSRALDYIRDHPGYVVETSAWNSLRMLDLTHDIDFDFLYEGLVLQATGVDRLVVAPIVLGGIYLVLALALAGIVAEVRRPSRRAPPFVWTFPLVVVLPAIAVYGLSRYRAPADPFLVMLAAVGINALLERGLAGVRARRSAQRTIATTSTTQRPIMRAA